MVLDLDTAHDEKQCSVSCDVNTSSVFFSSPCFALSAVFQWLFDRFTAFAHYKDEYTVQTSFLALVTRNMSQTFTGGLHHKCLLT